MPARADGSAVDWAAGIRGAWDISEAGALRQMAVFLDAGAPGGSIRSLSVHLSMQKSGAGSVRKGCVLARSCSLPGTAYALAGAMLQLAVCKHPAGM
jgi:hypothetical protein